MTDEWPAAERSRISSACCLNGVRSGEVGRVAPGPPGWGGRARRSARAVGTLKATGFRKVFSPSRRARSDAFYLPRFGQQARGSDPFLTALFVPASTFRVW